MVYLERNVPTSNIHRFYCLQVTKTLFGPWSVTRSWGRIGNQGGAKKEDWYDDKNDAIDAFDRIFRLKQRRGYRIKNAIDVPDRHVVGCLHQNEEISV